MKKKHFRYLLLIIIMMIILITNVDAAEEFYFCNADSVKAFKVIGYIIYTIKVVAPLCIIILASIDYFRAIMSNDEKAISVSTKSFIRRLIAGIVIFLVPTIVYALLDVLSPAMGDTEFNEYLTCTKCIFNPSDCNTEGLPELNQSSNQSNNVNSSQNDSDNNSHKSQHGKR